MTKLVVYDPDTGQILRNVDCQPDAVEIQALDGEDYMLVEQETDDLTQYVEQGETGPFIQVRPFFSLEFEDAAIDADGVDEFVIHGIPAGTVVDILQEGFTETVNDGVFEFVTEVPGDYIIKLTLWPYQDREITVTAT